MRPATDSTADITKATISHILKRGVFMIEGRENVSMFVFTFYRFIVTRVLRKVKYVLVLRYNVKNERQRKSER